MNVLIVDDHPMVLEYLSNVVAKAFEGAAVSTASELAGALEAARGGAFDLVLLDLGLPGYGGIEALLRLRRAFPELRVAVVSASDEPVSVRGALAAGAAGFIPKSAGPKMMVSALRLIAEGGKYFPPEALAGDLAKEPVSAYEAGKDLFGRHGGGKGALLARRRERYAKLVDAKRRRRRRR
jgi:DNA-binding NarL/FixJ family response regulator